MPLNCGLILIGANLQIPTGVNPGGSVQAQQIDIASLGGVQVSGSMPTSQNDAATLRDLDLLSQLAACVDPKGGGLRVTLDTLAANQTLNTVTTVTTVTAVSTLQAYGPSGAGLDALQTGVYQWMQTTWANSIRGRIT